MSDNSIQPMEMYTDEFTQPMTDDELDAIKRRLEHVTHGPWRWGDWGSDFGALEVNRNTLEYAPMYGGPDSEDAVRTHKEEGISRAVIDEEYIEGDCLKANRLFIAHARTDIPRLVAEIERVDNLKQAYIDHKGRHIEGYSCEECLKLLLNIVYDGGSNE